jgi:2-polyprenyl-3-methyl-5-hydroxy-6-metoxy-1,4-benzoquinol methylase
MPCPICHGREVRDSAVIRGGVALDRCDSCGHAFQRVREEEKCNCDMQLEYFGEVFAERQGLFFALYERLNAGRTLQMFRDRRNQKVLEIGPGSGRIMSCLARAGHKVEGLDLSPAVSRHIAKTWGLPVHVEPLEVHARRVGPQCYDVIVMRHVLEHFSNPCDALGTIYTLLKPQGVLYVAVPNIDSWHHFFHGWSGYQPYHLHYFSRRSLSRALISSGFHMSDCHTYESMTGWANTIVHSLRGNRSNHQPYEQNQNRRFRLMILQVARLTLGVILWPIRLLQSTFGRGEELNALAEKAV